MKLAILETGRPPGDLADEFGSYPAMFAELLGDRVSTSKASTCRRASFPSRRRTTPI